MNETEICAFDDLFDFNWTDLVDNSEVAVATIDTFEPIGTSLSDARLSSDRPVLTATITMKKKCEKEKRKPSRVRAFKKGMSVKDALLAYDRKPNMSRRSPTDVLVAFPVFDKCDSLLYFPTTLIRHFNTADMDATAKLMNKYLDRNCKLTFNALGLCAMSPSRYLQVMGACVDVEPDRIMCVHSTKVFENKIMASVYMKLTDLQPLYTSMIRIFNDKEFDMWADRAYRFQYYASVASDDQVKQDLLTWSQKTDNVLMYMRMDLILTFDHFTKKILNIHHQYEFTSMKVISNA